MIMQRIPRSAGLVVLFLISLAVFFLTWFLVLAPIGALEGEFVPTPRMYRDYLEKLLSPSQWGDTTGWILVFGSIQAFAFVAFVAPLVGPPRAGGEGRSLRASVIGASVIGGALGVGGVLAAVQAVQLALGTDLSVDAPFPSRSGELIVATLFAVWILAGAVWMHLLRAAGRSRDPNGIPRLLRILLRGTVVELTLSVPLYVLARRRENCACDLCTFFSIIGGTGVLIWMCGPLAVLWLTRGYRRAWRRGACPNCGYPRHTASRACSECGTAFTAAQDA